MFKNVPVAQLDRVAGYEPVGRGFESLQARHIKVHACQSSRMEGSAKSLKETSTLVQIQ